MSSTTSRSESPDHDSQFVPWWNPFHWPAGIWVLVVALLVMLTPFAIRTVMLMGVPDIPEPFDIVEFSKWDVPAREDAFTEYRRASELRRLLIVESDAKEPDDCLGLLDTGWAAASESTKKWLDLHQESLVHWRRGTQQDLGLNESPTKMDFTSILTVVQDQRSFVRLAFLEEARAISAGQFEEARQWARAAFRCGGHTTHRGPIIQGLVGVAIHSMASTALARWAEHPEVTSEQLQRALNDVRSDYQLYESESNLLKAEYLITRNTLRQPLWFQTLDDVTPTGAKSIAKTKAIQLGYWVIGEPELTLRISRQIIANQIPEIDQPPNQRRKIVGAGTVMLFDPAIPLAPGQLDPAGIDRAVKRSSLTRLLLPSVKLFDDALLKQVTKQATLEALLAIQAYRRDHGEFPESLSDLVPMYLPSIPVDPCSRSGGPLLYRRDEPAKAVVWSVGEDGNDDGGVLEIPNAKAPDVGFAIK